MNVSACVRLGHLSRHATIWSRPRRLRSAAGRPDTPRAVLLLRHLTADFSILVLGGVDVEVPFAGSEVRRLDVSQRRIAFDRAGERGCHGNYGRSIGTRGGRTMEMR